MASTVVAPRPSSALYVAVVKEFPAAESGYLLVSKLKGGPFEISTIESAQVTLMGNVAASPASGELIAFRDLTSRRLGDNTAIQALIRGILSGEVQAQLPAATVGSLQYLLSDVRRFFGTPVLEAGLSVTQLAKLTSWKHESIDHWIELGLMESYSIVLRVHPKAAAGRNDCYADRQSLQELGLLSRVSKNAWPKLYRVWALLLTLSRSTYMMKKKKPFVPPQTELTVALAKVVATTAHLTAQRVLAEAYCKDLGVRINAAVQARVTPEMQAAVDAALQVYNLQKEAHEAAKLAAGPLDSHWQAVCTARREYEAAQRALRKRTDTERAEMTAAENAILLATAAITESNKQETALRAAVQAETKARIAECLLKKEARRKSALVEALSARGDMY